MKKAFLSVACMAALLGVQQHASAAELIYGFNDPTISGFTPNPTTPPTVTPKKEALSESTSTGVTEGAGALDIESSLATTYGGAITAVVPADFANAPSFNVDVTITTTPVDSTGAAVYFDLVPVFFSTDGEIDPDTSNPANFINLGAKAPGTYTYTVNLAAYSDPDGILSGDNTPGAILAADQTADPADALTGFQLTVEHGASATSLFVDNITVPSAATPEPASIGALVLGGGALLARRRKA